jgi:cell division protein FtsZ
VAEAPAEEEMDLAGAEIVEEVEVEVVETQVIEPAVPPAPVARFDDIDGNDELILGAETVVQPLSEPQAAPAAPAAKPSGGTLFERMSGLSRGLGRGPSADDDDDDNTPTVTKFPQFLNRQGNQ